MPPFRSLSDDELVDLLYTLGDRVPRDVVDEFLRRGPRMVPVLAGIVADKAGWTQPLPEWWAVVHATYLLGAFAVPECLVPLLCALRWADAFDCDWVTEDLPSMFGRLGNGAAGALSRVLEDVTAGPGARSIALASLAAIALDDPAFGRELLDTAARLAGDPGEALYLRQTAANVLVDFRSRRHETLIRAFGRDEAERRRDDPEYDGVFYDWEVDELLAGSGPNADYYRRDWLVFYDPDEIERRQQRWRREQEEDRARERAPGPPAGRDLSAPCPCGSGRPLAECCYLKVH